MSGFTQFFRNFLPFKDGGAIPPSNAMERVGNFKKPFFPQPPGMPPMPKDFTFFGKRINAPVPKKYGGAIPPGMPKFLMPKKHGGAVKKRKAKPKKAKK